MPQPRVDREKDRYLERSEALQDECQSIRLVGVLWAVHSG
jgi:hypothetical protein